MCVCLIGGFRVDQSDPRTLAKPDKPIHLCNAWAKPDAQDVDFREIADVQPNAVFRAISSNLEDCFGKMVFPAPLNNEPCLGLDLNT